MLEKRLFFCQGYWVLPSFYQTAVSRTVFFWPRLIFFRRNLSSKETQSFFFSVNHFTFRFFYRVSPNFRWSDHFLKNLTTGLKRAKKRKITKRPQFFFTEFFFSFTEFSPPPPLFALLFWFLFVEAFFFLFFHFFLHSPPGKVIGLVSKEKKRESAKKREAKWVTRANNPFFLHFPFFCKFFFFGWENKFSAAKNKQQPRPLSGRHRTRFRWWTWKKK